MTQIPETQQREVLIGLKEVFSGSASSQYTANSSVGGMSKGSVSTIPSSPTPTDGTQSTAFDSCTSNSSAFSCLDADNFPVMSPRFVPPQDPMSPTRRRVNGGSPADAITGGALPTAGRVTPQPQGSTPPLLTAGAETKKPLYYETNICLSDFIKAIYGITGPTTGSGRDIGTSPLTTAQRLQNRQRLYKNASPLTGSDILIPKPFPNGKQRRLLLALDLDETLVHAFIGLRTPLPNADAHVEITTTLGNPPRKSVNAMYIRYRPHISEFMSVVAPLFDVVLFTAARPIYADTLMNVMDPKGSVIGKEARYFRDSCTDLYNAYGAGPVPMSPKGQTDDVAAAVAAEAGCDAANGFPPLAEPGYVRSKDLTKLGRPLDEIILIDNTPTCGLFQPRNLLPISSWFGNDMSDGSLLSVLPVLRKIAATRDVYGCLDEYCATMTPVV